MALSRDKIKQQLLEDIQKTLLPGIKLHQLQKEAHEQIDRLVDAMVKENIESVKESIERFEKKELQVMLEIILINETSVKPFITSTFHSVYLETTMEELANARLALDRSLIRHAERQLSKAITIEQRVPEVLQRFNLEEKIPSYEVLNIAREYAQFKKNLKDANAELLQAQKKLQELTNLDITTLKPKHHVIKADTSAKGEYIKISRRNLIFLLNL